MARQQREFLPSTNTEEEATTPSLFQGAYSPLTLWAAAAFAVILGFSRLSYGLVLPALRADLHGSYGVFGLVSSANLGGYLLGMLLVPALLKHTHDRVRLITFALLVLSVTLIASALSVSLIDLALWRLLIGVSSAVATVLTITLTLERVQPAERGRASGVLWMGGAAGLVVSGILAPLVIGTGVPAAWRLLWVGMGLVGLIATWGVRRSLRADTPRPPLRRLMPRKSRAGSNLRGPEDQAEPRSGRKDAGPSGTLGWRSDLLALLQPDRLLALTLSYFAAAFAYIIYFTFVIALLIHQGLPPLLAGLTWSIAGLGGVIGSLFWGWAVDRRPSGFVLAIALVLGAMGAVTTLTGQLLIETVGAFLIGMGSFGAPTIVTALLKRAVPGAGYATSLSLLTAIFSIGQMIGPIVAGVIVDTHGLAPGTASAALMFACAALLAMGYGIHQFRDASSGAI
ncbi:MAG: YbfB/YjiJ family MFS transporter [Chloroflexota bacterium]|nr:YbfB/YjiJ family MFS transporter [Chloroflexota bacterium]